MAEFSVANMIYTIGLGISFILANVLLHYMAGLGLIVANSVLIDVGIGLMIAGVGLIILFVILFFVALQVA
jgi:hypothetical protein